MRNPRSRRALSQSAASGTVTLTLAEQTTDLDLFVLRETDAGGACEPRGNGCIGASVTDGDEVVSFAATSGESYYVIVDGPGNGLGSFTLEVACP